MANNKKFMAQVELEIETENVLEAHDVLTKAMKKVNIENAEIGIVRMQVIDAAMMKQGGK